jgi:hypothetical protein
VTNSPDVAKAFFDEQTIGILIDWKTEKQGFSQECAVDMTGFLFHDKGTIAGCQASMVNAKEAKVFADFCSTLVFKMEQVIKSNEFST